MRVLRTPFHIIRTELQPYLLLNAMAYGLLLLGLALGMLFPGLNAALSNSMDAGGTTDLVVSLLASPWLFTLTIFFVNIVKVALASILLPSMIVPFGGLAVFAYFAVETGIALAPVDHATAMTLIPHSLTMLIEFQAYILLLLGSFILGRCWLKPGTVDAANRRWGYLRGLQRFGWLALPALMLLIIGAVYEAFSLTYLVPLLFAS